MQPGVDPLGDVGPSRFEHHVVAHAWKELGFGPVSPRRGADLGVGDHAVFLGAENQHGGSYPCGSDAANQRVDEGGAHGLGLDAGRTGFDDVVWSVRAEKMLAD